MKNKRRVCRIIPVLLWMGIIFYLSHQPATTSSQLSGGITRQILQIIEYISPITMDEDLFHTFIRKTAHFTAYAILGLLIVHAFSCKSLYKRAFYALTISFLYAVSDEFHQLFIPGRSGEVRDVIIDSLGALSGILIYLIIYNIYYKKMMHKSLK